MNPRRTGLRVLSSALLVSACAATPDRPPAAAEFDPVWSFAEAQLTRTSQSVPLTRHARSAGLDGKWTTVGAGDWTSGFYAGCLWLMHDHTGKAEWRKRAEAQTADLESQKNNTSDHDVGF